MLWAYFIPFYKWETDLPKVPDLVRASWAASHPPGSHPLGDSVAALGGQAAGQTSGLSLRVLYTWSLTLSLG